jgi:hypothetical protein
MPVEVHPLLPAVIGGLVGAITGAIGAYMVRRGLDKQTLTIKQYELYHSDKMVAARTTAWDYLTSPQFVDRPLPISHFYRGPGLSENATYQAIVQVMSFWYLLGVLYDENEIVPELARKLLRTQYLDWKGALEPLLKATQDAHISLEALALLNEGENRRGMMYWLERT